MFFPPQRVIKVSLTSERNTIITLHSSVTLFYFIQSHLKFVFLKEKEQVSLKGQGWRGLGDRMRVCLGLQVWWVGEPRAWHEQDVGMGQRAGDVPVPWAPCGHCAPPVLTGHCSCAMPALRDAPSLPALQQGGNRQRALARAGGQGCPRPAASCLQPSAQSQTIKEGKQLHRHLPEVDS